jgi:hypothetical protein
VRRKRTRGELELERHFGGVLGMVEHAKDELVGAIPSSRTAGMPLAQALLSFDTALREAERGMAAWRDDAIADVWEACRAALAEALGRADRLRQEAPDLGFESLLATIAELIAPLEAFEQAADRIRELVRD